MNFGLGIILNFTDNASARMVGVVGAFGGMSAAADQSQSRLTKFAKSLGGIGKALTASVSLPLIGVAQRIARVGIEKGSLLQNMQLAIDTLLPEHINTGQFVRELDEMAATVPIANRYFMTGAQTLIMYGLEAENVQRTLQTLTDVAGGTGRGVKGFNSSIRYMGLIASGAGLQMNQLQAMIAHSGIQADRVVGNLLGITDVLEAQRTVVQMSQTDNQKLIELLLYGLEQGTYGALGFTAAFEGAGIRLLETFEGARKFMTDAWDIVGVQAMGKHFDEVSGMYRFSNLDNYIAPAMVNFANSIKELAPLFENMLVGSFRFINSVSEIAYRAASWFAGLDPVMQSFISRMTTIIALLGPALVLFSTIAGTLLPLLKRAFLNAAFGIVRFIAVAAPMLAFWGAIFLIWNRDLGGIRTSVERTFRSITNAVRFARDLIRGDTNEMILAFNRLGEMNTWQARLMSGIIATHTVFSAFRNYLRDGHLYEEQFQALYQMGLLPTLDALLNIHERWQMFVTGFQDGLAAFAASFVGTFRKIADYAIIFGRDLTPVTEILQNLADSDPAVWYSMGRALGEVVIPMMLIGYALGKLYGLYGVLGKLALGFGKICVALSGKGMLKFGGLAIVLGALYFALRDTEAGADIMHVLGNLFEIFMVAIEGLVPVVLGLIESLVPLATMTFSVFIGALELVLGLLVRFTDWAAANPGIVQGVVTTIFRLYVAFKALKIIGGIIALIGALAAKFKALTIVKVALTIAAWAKNAALMANPITWVVLAVVALIAIIAALVVAVVKNWDKIMAVLRSVAGWVNDNVIQPIVGFFTGLWEAITGVISGIWETITSIFGAIADWVMSSVVDPMINFFSTLGAAIAGVFRGVRDTVKNVMSSVVNVVRKPINAIIGLLNSFIGSVNRIQIPNWVPGVGGRGINLPKIPTLNTGGFIKNEGMAYLHPAEVVLNSKLTKGLSDILANSDMKGAMIVKSHSDKPAMSTLGSLGNEQLKSEPVGFTPAPMQNVVVKVDPANVPVRKSKDPAVSQTSSLSGGNVLFEAGSIVVNVASATLEEAKKFADMVYKEIKRKKELEDMKNYRKIDRRLQTA